jgi:hypothetical protein
MPTTRRFRLPWTIVERPGCFCVDDADGKVRGTFYFLPERLFSLNHTALARDEALRLAVNFTRLPELVGTNQPSDQTPDAPEPRQPP